MKSFLTPLKSLLLLITLLAFVSTAGYAEASYKTEISHLLNYVKHTKCLYERNGDKHNGNIAVKHISRKYEHFKDEIHTAEDFIRLSATQSMMSGKKYHILCPGKKPVESGIWLLEELQKYRTISH